MRNEVSATITINFDPTQPGAAGKLADTLGALLVAFQERGLRVDVESPEPGPDLEEDEDLDPMVPAPVPAARGAVPGPAAPVKRIRDRTAERRAARERAEAEAKAKQAQGNGGEFTNHADDPLLGAGGGAGMGDPFDADPEADAAPASPVPDARVRTPQQCKADALAVLRPLYGKGSTGKAAVDALRKTHKVTSFLDMTPEQAVAIWKDSEVLARQFGIQIPAGS